MRMRTPPKPTLRKTRRPFLIFINKPMPSWKYVTSRRNVRLGRGPRTSRWWMEFSTRRIRQVVTESKMKHKIFEACHNNTVRQYHFGWDKTLAKLSTHYYWKGIKQDVNDWVNWPTVSSWLRRLARLSLTFYLTFCAYKLQFTCEMQLSVLQRKVNLPTSAPNPSFRYMK